MDSLPDKTCTTPTESIGYRSFLLEQLSTRKVRNPAYSLRAFSRTLGVSPTTLSQVISGKRPLSLQAAALISERLLLPPDDKEKLLQAAHWGSRLQKVAEKAVSENRASQEAYAALAIETFAIIADWYHYAILSLLRVKGFRWSPKWVGYRMGISEKQAKGAMARLKKLGLIERVNGIYRQTGKSLSAIATIKRSATLRNLSQTLRKAETSLLDDPIETRDCTAITMAIDPAKMDMARGAIRRFRRQFCTKMERGRLERVYTLSIQFFPMDKIKEVT